MPYVSIPKRYYSAQHHTTQDPETLINTGTQEAADMEGGMAKVVIRSARKRQAVINDVKPGPGKEKEGERKRE